MAFQLLTLRATFLRSRLVHQVLGWALGLFVAFNLFSFLILPLIARPFLEEKLGKALHRPVSIAKIFFNPYRLSTEITGLSVRVGETEVAGFERLYLDLAAASLWQGGLLLQETRLEAPRVRVTRLKAGRYDISDLLEEWAKPSDSPTTRFALSHLEIVDGQLIFEDKPSGLTHKVADLSLSLPFLSNLPPQTEVAAEPRLSATINGVKVAVSGHGKPFSETRESEVSLNLGRIDLLHYLPYAPLQLPFLLKSGNLDADLKLRFSAPKNQPATLQLAGTAQIKDLKASEINGQPLIACKTLSLGLREADLGKRRVVLDQLRLDGFEGHMRRNAQGRLNWQDIQASLAGSKTEKNLPAQAPERVASTDTAWNFTAQRLLLADGMLRYEDDGLPIKTVQVISSIEARIEDFSTAPGKKAALTLAARINGEGNLQAKGHFQLQPLATQLNLDLTSLPLLPLQPYFTERLNLILTRGQLSGQGNLDLESTKDGFDGDFKGQITIGDLHSVDRIGHTDFLAWKSLFLGNIEARLQPFSLALGQAALSDFYAQVAVSAEGKLNLMHLLRPAKAPSGPPGEPLPLRVDQVSFQGGTVNFSDNFVKPNYSVNVTRLGGRITGLSSAPGTLADLELRGTYGPAAPVEIRAKLNPLSARAYLDLKGEIRGVDLTSLSTYAGKYAGYAIEKGGLSLYVTYKLDHNQLTADNRLFLDQLTFGDPVKSPRATSLPVKLAVALLKNDRGEIDLNLPISGSIDDPQFSLGGVIVRLIRNLLVKAVTSPFTFLGSLFGGGADLASVDFQAGRAALNPSAIQKLADLARALRERPALHLEITGQVDPERDREGLKHFAIEQAVSLEKLRDEKKPGPGNRSLASTTVEAKEYPAYLERAYRAAKFPKPRNLIGLPRELPVAEMERLMLANTPVGEAELRQLATRRAEAVQAWLVEEGKVPPERLLLLPSANTTAPPASRVNFSLH